MSGSRGSFDFHTEKDSRIVICERYDNKTVTIGSNKHSLNPMGSCHTYDRKRKNMSKSKGLAW